MKCNKCGELNKDNAKFCASCGEKLEIKKVFCTECGKELENGSIFCEACGSKQKVEKGLKLNLKNIDFAKIDLSSKIISISFLICAILGIYLFSKNGFFRWLLSDSNINANKIAVLAISLGLIIFFVKRKKLDIKEMLNSIKKLSFNKNVVAFIFIISGIIIYLIQNDTVFRVDGMKVLICFLSFIFCAILFLSILLFNWDILKKPFLIFSVLLGIGLFIFLGGSKRIAKRAVIFLESNGYTCKLENETYTCNRTTSGETEEWTIDYYIGSGKPSINLEVMEDKYNYFNISLSSYYNQGFIIYHQDGINCYYIPDKTDLGNVSSMDVGTFVYLDREYGNEDCQNRASKINEYLRKYESLHNRLNIEIK